MRRPFTRLTNFLATGFTAIAALFSKPEPRKKKGPRKPTGDGFQMGQADSRVPSNVLVLSERPSRDGRTTWLFGYNCKHHPKGLPEGKGGTYYRVREHAI